MPSSSPTRSTEPWTTTTDDDCDKFAAMSANLANQSGRLVLRRDVKFNGVKIFSATMVADRDQLGEKVTDWMQRNTHLKITDIVITQSSDEAFHCIAFTLFYWQDLSK
jgi:hypothetical protein